VIGPNLERLWNEMANHAQVRHSERTYAMGCATVQVTVSTLGLARWLSPAIEHRETTATAPDFSIAAFECASTSFSNEARVELQALIQVGQAADSRFRAAIGAGGVSLQIFDLEESSGIYWVERADLVPAWERAAPYRCLAAWGLEAHGLVLAHAAALAVGDQAVLVTGPSGRGKSTIALGWVSSGGGYLADDFVAVSDQAEKAYGLFRSAKISPAELQTRFSRLNHTCWGGEGEKAILLFDESVCRLPSNAQLRAVVALAAGRASSPRLVPCTAKTALLALAPSSVLQVPGVRQAAFSRLGSLVRRVPTCEMTLSTEREANVAMLGRFLEQN